MLLKRLLLLTSLFLLFLFAPPGAALADGFDTHTVQRGETLATIAAQHGITLHALVAANKIGNPDLVRAGQKLLIPGTRGQNPAPRSNPSPAYATGSSSYTVRPGQSLSQIAALLGVNSTALAQANRIGNPDLIRPGQKLIIPGRSGNAGSAGAAGTARQTSGTRFVASISQQRCWLYQAGQLIGDWPCSSGRKGSPTVPGTYKIQSKINPAYASTWDFWMPYWLGIYYAGSVENGIHGLPYNPKTGRRTWEGLVGTPITYGCIMLDDENARKVYEVAYIGMPVIILP